MQSKNDKGIRWPIITAVCLIMAASCWLLLTKNHFGQPKTEKSERQETNHLEEPLAQQTPSNTATRISSNVGKISPATSTNSGPMPQNQSSNPNSDKLQKMVTLAAGSGAADELEKAIHDIAALGDSVVPELKLLLQPDQTMNVREAAAKALAEIGSHQSVSTLLDAVLAEQDDEQRRALVSALHALNNATAAPELAAALLKSQDPIVFPTVRDTLARVADATATLTIAQTFHNDASEGWQQSNLMGTLLRVRSPDAVSSLRQIVLQDSDFSLRSQAAIALGYIGNQDAIQALLDAVNQSQSTAFKAVLIQSLGAVNNKESQNELIGFLNQSTIESVRYVAAMALGNIPNASSMDALKSAYPNETSQLVKQTIETSLNKLGQSGSSPAH
jgi:HEAT repeat protein